MAKWKEDKLVDYGGTALSVVGILACACFYPGVVAAYHSKQLIWDFGGGEYCILIQFFIFAGISGVIWGFLGAIHEAGTNGEKWIGIIVLLLIYIPTFMPFVRILQEEVYK